MSLEGWLANRPEACTVDLVRFTEVKEPDTGNRSPDWFVVQADVQAHLWEKEDEDVLREYGPEEEGRHGILIDVTCARKVGLKRDDGIEVHAGQPQYSGRTFKIVSDLTPFGVYFRALLREMPREDFGVRPPPGAGSAYSGGYSNGYGSP